MLFGDNLPAKNEKTHLAGVMWSYELSSDHQGGLEINMLEINSP